jgi:hypothetical protein
MPTLLKAVYRKDLYVDPRELLDCLHMEAMKLGFSKTARIQLGQILNEVLIDAAIEQGLHPVPLKPANGMAELQNARPEEIVSHTERFLDHPEKLVSVDEFLWFYDVLFSQNGFDEHVFNNSPDEQTNARILKIAESAALKEQAELFVQHSQPVDKTADTETKQKKVDTGKDLFRFDPQVRRLVDIWGRSGMLDVHIDSRIRPDHETVMLCRYVSAKDLLTVVAALDQDDDRLSLSQEALQAEIKKNPDFASLNGSVQRSVRILNATTQNIAFGFVSLPEVRQEFVVRDGTKSLESASNGPSL